MSRSQARDRAGRGVVGQTRIGTRRHVISRLFCVLSGVRRAAASASCSGSSRFDLPNAFSACTPLSTTPSTSNATSSRDPHCGPSELNLRPSGKLLSQRFDPCRVAGSQCVLFALPWQGPHWACSRDADRRGTRQHSALHWSPGAGDYWRTVGRQGHSGQPRR